MPSIPAELVFAIFTHYNAHRDRFFPELMEAGAAAVADMKIDEITKKITRIYSNNDVINSISRVWVKKFVGNPI